MLLQGCYETLPLQQGQPPVSKQGVQLTLNDRGRVAVAEKLGTGVSKVEGTITAQDATSYTMAMSHVWQLNGSSTTWNGELVTIPKDASDSYQVRQYNKTRTLALAGAITVAVVVFFVTATLHAGGTGTNDTSPGQNPGQTR
jgi:hypothetical protein